MHGSMNEPTELGGANEVGRPASRVNRHTDHHIAPEEWDQNGTSTATAHRPQRIAKFRLESADPVHLCASQSTRCIPDLVRGDLRSVAGALSFRQGKLPQRLELSPYDRFEQRFVISPHTDCGRVPNTFALLPVGTCSRWVPPASH